jgi:hypothetical protein
LVQNGPDCVVDGKRRGDRVEHVQDLFRLLRRGREYLIEADRQLRGGGSEEEQAARDAWYADMDANDEWTGFTAEAHADCVLDILSFFEEHEPFINYLEGGIFLVGLAWKRFDAALQLEELRNGMLAVQARIGAQSSRQ